MRMYAFPIRQRPFVFLLGLVVPIPLFLPFGSSAHESAPVGEWSFSTGSGNAAADASGTGYTAIPASGISWLSTPIGEDLVADASCRQYASTSPIDLSVDQSRPRTRTESTRRVT